MPAFRNGQWVKFKPAEPIAGAHLSADDLTVGIFVRGGIDAAGQKHDDRIMVVDDAGENISYIKDGTIASVSVDPADAAGVQPVDDVGDLPLKRRATMRADFCPSA